MVDMGGLDNLIANAAYLQARKSSDADSKELQRRRRSLMLPGPQSCEQLRQALATDFHSLCEQQPIGRRLFRDFLATVPAYQEARGFLEEVQSWELAEEGPAKGSALQGLVTTCAAAPVPGRPHPFFSPALVTKCQAATTDDDRASLVELAKAEVMAFLQDQPFREFLASPFYDKFLQWKVFEMQPVSDKYFEEFRVLGKEEEEKEIPRSGDIGDSQLHAIIPSPNDSMAVWSVSAGTELCDSSTRSNHSCICTVFPWGFHS